MRRTAKVFGTLCLAVLLGTMSGCKDQTARDMAKQVADSLVAYGQRNGDYLALVHSAVCNLDLSIWDQALNPDPADPTKTLINPRNTPVMDLALCPPVGPGPEHGDPPEDPEDPFS